MNINLRKANAIQRSITDVLSSIDIATTANLNITEYDDAAQVIEQANLKAIKDFERSNALLEALYDIRLLVGAANQASGIAEQLNKLALMQRKIVNVAELANAPQKKEISEIKKRQINIQKNDKASFRSDTISTGVLASSIINTWKITLLQMKNTKQQLQDELLSLNVHSTITLSESTVETLKKEVLI